MMQLTHKRISLAVEAVLMHTILLVGLLISIFPFYWMLMGSLKTRGEIFVVPPQLGLKNPHFENYLHVFIETNFGTGFLNSCFVTFTKTFCTLLFSAMSGFAFAKYDFPGKNGLFAFLLATMMIPGMVTFIPVFMVIVRIKWVDTYQALIVPGLASAFGTFLMRQYMFNVPDETIDAARIDGAGDFRLFFQIALPITVPALISLAIFTFFGNWNDLFWPIIIIRSREKYTLALSLMTMRSKFPKYIDYSVILAASVLATLPTLVVFVLLQRHFVSGITTGALKG